MADRIVDFKDLNSWKEAHKLVLLIYLESKKFPKDEIYGITSQMRRAVVSITSNIAEGFGRQSFKEKVHFYHIAQGSLIELKNQIEIVHDIGYIPDATYGILTEQANSSHRLLQGLIRKSKEIHNSHS